MKNVGHILSIILVMLFVFISYLNSLELPKRDYEVTIVKKEVIPQGKSSSDLMLYGITEGHNVAIDADVLAYGFCEVGKTCTFNLSPYKVENRKIPGEFAKFSLELISIFVGGALLLLIAWWFSGKLFD